MTTQIPDEPLQMPDDEAWRTENPELKLGESWRKDRRYKPRSSSRWLSPPQLIIAAYKQLVAGLFESFSDRRDSLETRASVVLTHSSVKEHEPGSAIGDGLIVRALLPNETNVASTSSDSSDNDTTDSDATDSDATDSAEAHTQADADNPGFWFDYVADVGDGFSATYSVAEEIALTNEWNNEKEYATEDGSWKDAPKLSRGQLLVMGGDEVYPLASDTEYRNRTVGPYETACRSAEPGMALLAVPGNHDWYDGLTAFLSRFCSEQWIGGWQTRQSRSYWAAKVQPGWWLWGVDLALEHTPIDHHQLAYFREVAALLEPNDRIILATPKPAWLRDRKAWLGGGSPSDEPYNPSYDQLAFFKSTTMHAWYEHARNEHKLDAQKVDPATLDEEEKPQFAMVLAGDKHCYSRYDNDEQAQASEQDFRDATTALKTAQNAVRSDPVPAESGHVVTTSLDIVIDKHEKAESNVVRRVPHVLCGGGGAYLSLPFHHAEKVSVPRRWREQSTLELDLKKQWPERAATNRLARTSLWRIVIFNWGFGALLGTVYLLFARAINAVDPIITTDPFAPALTWGANISRYAEAIVSSWSVFLLTIALVFGLQARSHLGATTRYGLAIAQTVIHLVAIAGCDAFARWTAGSGGPLSGDQWSAVVLLVYALSWSAWGFYRWMMNGRAPRHTLLAPALFGFALYVFVAEPNTWSWLIPMIGVSSIIGAVVFAATLLTSVYTFGDKENLVSVTVREPGWKNFLRIHIEGDICRVWAIGLQKVPHQRLIFRKDGAENYVPTDPSSKTEPAKFTPEVTPIYGGILGNSRQGYDARIIDSWTIQRHPTEPTPATIDTTEPIGHAATSKVSA